MKHVDLWTDGSCHPNPGPGGWAYVLIFGELIREDSGFEAATSNNRMELRAVIEGLNALNQPCEVTIYCDSQWVVKCAQRQWKRRTNNDLWLDFDDAARRHHVRWQWVKGHIGAQWNERCDTLAGAARRAGVIKERAS